MDDNEKETAIMPDDPATVNVEDVPASDVAETFVPDMERLLQPISDDAPCGELLRYEGTYDRIQEARRTDDADIPQGVWERALKKADWKTAYALCLDALENRTKDLQIAVWLLESLLYLRGFNGVKDGLALILGLCQRFWDDLYPPLEPDDPEGRVAPLIWVNEKLAVVLKLKPITMPHGADTVAYTFDDWEGANRLENLAHRDPNAYEQAEAEGRVTRAKFLGSVMFSSRDFYVQQAAGLRGAIQHLDDLNTFLNQECGRGAPSLKRFADTLVAIEELTSTFIKEKQGDEPEPEAGSAAERETTETETDGEEITSATQIRDRAHAYRALAAAADYLLVHEPHSPTPYLVKRAISWGHMTLMELLQELVSDEQDLGQIYKLLGLRHRDRDYDEE